jgi:hypothetical protein
MIHRIDLQAPKKSYGKTLMRSNGKDIGASNSPIFAAARWLLDNNAAFEDDTVETYRGNTLCMSGKAGELAKWTVQENAHGNPSLQLACWRPFPTAAVRPRTAKSSPSQAFHQEPKTEILEPTAIVVTP